MDHHISVRQLKELLTELNDHYILVPNVVGNLLIINEQGKSIGFIDLLSGQPSVELFSTSIESSS